MPVELGFSALAKEAASKSSIVGVTLKLFYYMKMTFEKDMLQWCDRLMLRHSTEETLWLAEITALHMTKICWWAVNPNSTTIPIDSAPTSIISVSNENVMNIILQSKSRFCIKYQD